LIDALVASVAGALAKPGALSFGAAVLWGLMSVFLSPCHLGSIPLIVGFINNGGKASRRRAFLLSFLFALGLLVTLAAMGFIAAVLGTLFGRVGLVPRIAVAVFLVLCGLWLMDVPPLSRIGFPMNAAPTRRGAFGALSLGLIYGVILGPCSFAFLAPMLGIVFSAGGGNLGFGIGLMVAFALGHCGAIVAAGTFGDAVRAFLTRRGSGKAATWFKRGCGAIVVAAGVLQIIG
jgi:cytochrome c-type biogenesis protein